MPTANFMRAEQRRAAAVALLTAVWLLGWTGVGVHDAHVYLAPAVVLLAVLVLGRYPGADLLTRRARRRSSARKEVAAQRRPTPPVWLLPLRLLEGSVGRRGPPWPGLA
jgi:hypothetical protein